MNFGDTSTWVGLQVGASEPFLAMPAQTVLSGKVRLQPMAELRYTVRDEAAERKRLLAAIEAICARAAGSRCALQDRRVEWRSYREGVGEDEGPTAVLILTLADASRERRRELLRDLLDFLAEDSDPVVRERIAIRVR